MTTPHGQPVDRALLDFTAAEAREVDRTFVAGMDRCARDGGRDLAVRHGGSAAVGWLIEFRTALAWPDRPVGAAGFAAVTRYRDPVACHERLLRAAELGTIALEPDGSFRATPAGRDFLAELFRHQATATTGYWAEHADRFDRLLDRLGRALAAATADGGVAFGTMAPPYEPPGAAPALLLLNRLGTLRYHRADAHAAAWAADGLTAARMVALPPGERRDAVEERTNRGNAVVWSVLDEAERAELLADLRVLPG